MVVISVCAGVGVNVNSGVNIRYGNNESIVLPPCQNLHHGLINNPAYQGSHTVNYHSVDSWNHSARGHQQPNYRNINSDSSVYIVQEGQPHEPYIDNEAGNNQKIWNAALAALNALSNISSKETATQSAIDNLAHSSRTLLDSLKESGALSSSNQEPRGYSSDCNSRTHSHISPSNCYSPNTNAVSRLVISPNGNQLSVNGSNYSNNGGLTLVSGNNSYRERPTYYNQLSSNYNDIQISQGENGSVIINLPSNTIAV